MTTLSKIIALPGALFSNLQGLRNNLAAPIVVLSQWEKSKFFSFPSQGAEMVRDMVSVSEVITAMGFFGDLGQLNKKVVTPLKCAETLNSGCKFLNYLASRKIFQWGSTAKGFVGNLESATGIFVAGVGVFNSDKKSRTTLELIRDASFLAFEVLKSPWFKRDSDTLKLCALTSCVFAGLAHETMTHFNK